jgi:lysophospholipase L1-like esterase
MLQPMQNAVTTERLYAYTAADMHPNNNGYRVIAETIVKYLGNK